jgi:CheY-like chemotaxis protein
MPTVLFTKTCGRDLPLAKYQAGLIAKHWKNTPHHVWVVDSEAERRELIKALVSSYPSGYTSNEATYVLGESPPLDGAQQLLVFSDGNRSMGLMVDEIVDIVEDRLDIEVGSDRAGVLGSAVVRGKATEIIDVGHFLPLAYADWFRGKDLRAHDHQERTLLLVDDSAFFRNMLSPVLKAAGYEVTAVSSGHEALAILKKGRRFDALVTDIDMPEMDGFELAEAVRGEQRFGEIPIIALSSSSTPESIERGRQAGLQRRRTPRRRYRARRADPSFLSECRRCDRPACGKEKAPRNAARRSDMSQKCSRGLRAPPDVLGDSTVTLYPTAGRQRSSQPSPATGGQRTVPAGIAREVDTLLCSKRGRYCTSDDRSRTARLGRSKADQGGYPPDRNIRERATG